MKYFFEINVYTDGDFNLQFVPCGMKYDGNYNYSFEKSYTEKKKAIEDVLNICDFLKNHVTGRDYAVDFWNECINSFVEKVKTSDKVDIHEKIEVCMTGNHDGTEFCFYAKEQYLNCGFYVTDEEFEMVKNVGKRGGLTNTMVKEAVLDLFRQSLK